MAGNVPTPVATAYGFEGFTTPGAYFGILSRHTSYFFNSPGPIVIYTWDAATGKTSIRTDPPNSNYDTDVCQGNIAKQSNTSMTASGTCCAECIVNGDVDLFILSDPLDVVSPTTTVAVTANGTPVTTVESHTAITLTATVKAGSTPLTLGQVKFCNAAATFCEDSNLLGTAQLTAAGTAVLKLVPGLGSHTYKAVFAGTHTYPSSSATSSTLTVTGAIATKTSITSSGSAGAYTLTAQVKSLGATVPPPGTVFFQDKTDADAVLAQGSLGPGLGESVSWKSVPGSNSEFDHMPHSGTIADFNNDGLPDFAGLSADGNEVSVLLSNGDGTFTAAPSPQIADALLFVTADYNADGKADLAVISSQEPRLLTILLGNGDGTFITLPSRALEFNPSALVTADFNGDGKMDLATGDFAVHVLFGHGDGTFTGSTNVDGEQNGGPQHTLLIGDFDGDGNTDLFTTINSRFFILFGHGDGKFTVTQTDIENEYSAGLAYLVADFNNDGRSDIAVPKNLLALLLSKGNGSFTKTPVLLPKTPALMTVNDFNADGNADLVLQGCNTYVMLGDGKGHFTAAPDPSPVPDCYSSLYTADFNGDGFPDLLNREPAYITRRPTSRVLLDSWMQTATISGSSKALTGAGTHQVVARYQGTDTFITSVSKPIALDAPTGAVPIATFSTLNVPFAQQPVGEPSNGKTVTLTNTGTAVLTLSSLAVVPSPGKGPGFATSNNCPASLAVGASCKIRFRFVPGSAGYKASTLVIGDNAGNSPQTITLSGTGVSEP